MVMRFNPRIREGCDDILRHDRKLQHCFNPRIREGCDGDLPIGPSISYNVSIHASVRDATLALAFMVSQLLCFNPRIREGCDI
mgnify:CR=1 FL=1